MCGEFLCADYLVPTTLLVYVEGSPQIKRDKSNKANEQWGLRYGTYHPVAIKVVRRRRSLQ